MAPGVIGRSEGQVYSGLCRRRARHGFQGPASRSSVVAGDLQQQTAGGGRRRWRDQRG